MGFMEREITHKQAWYSVDGHMGTEYVPADLVGDITIPEDGTIPEALAEYCQNREAWSIERIEGFGARMSAPGYMDATEWTVFPTEAEAEAYLTEYYADDEDEDESEDDNDSE